MLKSKAKYIQSLSHKKHRDEHRVFVAEGPKIINELLQIPGVELLELYALKDWLAAQPANIGAAVEIDETTLQRISFLTTPNQVLGVFRQPARDASVSLSGTITLMADNIQDPGNLGSMIRCADWFGLRQVVCSPDCVDIYNPKTIQATMGSIGRVRVMYADLEATLTAHHRLDVYAATLSGSDLRLAGKITEGAILVGNESKGIHPRLQQLATRKITIPGRGGAESLNAAIATGIILSHLVG